MVAHREARVPAPALAPGKELRLGANTLTQRAIGPESVSTVELETKGMLPGDVAGLALLQFPHAWLGMVRTDNGFALRYLYQTETRFNQRSPNIDSKVEVKDAPISATKVWLRVATNFETNKARFSYSTDGKTYREFGSEFTMHFGTKAFQGNRIALFNFNSNGTPGGYADFTHFRIDEPRPSGFSRPIPVGQFVRFKSKAADAFIGVTGNAVVASPTGDAPETRFQVSDQGQGRVALKASEGKFLSVNEQGAVTLKEGASSINALFQWIEMDRRDLCLLSLASNRYLILPPQGGDVRADQGVPAPDRTDGAGLDWQIAQ